MKYWTTPLGTAFSIDIYLDTNILEYIVSNEYPSLTKLLDELSFYPEFVTLKATQYILFEFCEIRKRYYFKRLAESKGENLNDREIRQFDSNSLNFVEECVPLFLEKIERDRDKIIDDYNLEISKEFHSKLWERTLGVSLRTQLSREDCFVLASSLMPDESSIPQLISLMTNDNHLRNSFYNNTVLSDYFDNNELVHPVVWYIRCNDISHECFGERNLTENYDDDFISSYCKKVILKFLIMKQKDNFIGRTFNVAPLSRDIIGVQFDRACTSSIRTENRIVIVSKDLDFIVLCPHSVGEFRDKDKNQIEFPFSITEAGAFTFQFPAFDNDTIQGKFQDEIFLRLKEVGNLVFLLPS